MIQETIAEFTKSIDMKPLQYLAAVRLTITVCESEDVQCMIGRFHNKNKNGGAIAFSDDHWGKLHSTVKRNLNQVSDPDIIIDMVLEKLWPISFEVSKWIIYHFRDTAIDCSSNFCWTPQVSIDYVKTAETMIKNEALDVKKRFSLACIYCMESEVRSLWEQMNLPERRFFFIRGNLKKFKKNQIVRYWTYYIQEVPIDHWGSKVLNDTFLFKYAVENGYLVASKFFLGQIRENLKGRMLSNCFTVYLRKLYNSEFIVRDHLAIACFILGLYSSDYGIQFFNTLFFKYFLEWPMQKHFLIVANRVRQRLRDRNFGEVLEGIFEKDIDGLKDYDYKTLFMEFWQQSPQQHKRYVSSGSRVGYKIFMKLVKTHFGFIFEENAFDMKAKFRGFVFLQDIPENVTPFEKENIEFFKFLVEQRVIIKPSIERFSQPRRDDNDDDDDDDNFMLFSFQEDETDFNLPLEELMYLIDGILERV